MKTWRNHQKCMYTYVHSFWVISTETVSSDKIEELKILADIMKLVPSFKDVVKACSDHLGPGPQGWATLSWPWPGVSRGSGSGQG